MKNVYLILTIVGTIAPYVFFAEFFAAHGFSPVAFVLAWFENGASGGIAADVIVSSAAFWTYLAAERAPRMWLYVVLNLLVGLSCALPLYLYLRGAPATQPSAVYSG